MRRGIAAAAKCGFQSGGKVGVGEVLVGRGDDQGGSRQAAHDVLHARASLQHGDAAGGEMRVVGGAEAVRGEVRVEFGGTLAASHRLHVGDQIDQVIDRRVVGDQAHRVGAGKSRVRG